MVQVWTGPPAERTLIEARTGLNQPSVGSDAMSDERHRHRTRTSNGHDPTLSVVVPAFNESERIVSTIASIVAHLTLSGISFEVIVSDDGSVDGTEDIVRRLGLHNVVVLDPGVNRGKGAAVRSGMQAARGAFVVFSDADLSTPIQEIDKMLEAGEHSEVVIGSRGVAGSAETGRATRRRLLSWAARRSIRLVLGVAVSDTQDRKSTRLNSSHT